MCSSSHGQGDPEPLVYIYTYTDISEGFRIYVSKKPVQEMAQASKHPALPMCVGHRRRLLPSCSLPGAHASDKSFPNCEPSNLATAPPSHQHSSVMHILCSSAGPGICASTTLRVGEHLGARNLSPLAVLHPSHPGSKISHQALFHSAPTASCFQCKWKV